MDHVAGIPLSTPPAPRRDLVRLVRVGICAGLVISWLAMLLYAWSAFSTLPSAERLQESRMTAIPTLVTFRNLLLRSGAELAVLLLLLWPSARMYLTRTAAALLGMAAYFLATVPLSVTTMSWVHRRWLAAMVIALFGILVAGVTARIMRYMMPARAQPPASAAAQQGKNQGHDVQL